MEWISRPQERMAAMRHDSCTVQIAVQSTRCRRSIPPSLPLGNAPTSSLSALSSQWRVNPNTTRVPNLQISGEPLSLTSSDYKAMVLRFWS
jgi:hypothetical protein